MIAKQKEGQMRGCVAVCVVAGLLTVACDNSGPPSTTAPTNANVPTVPETFTGTLAVQGLNSHAFTVTQVGTITVTLTAVGPPSTISVGLAAGSVSAGNCSLSQASAIAAQAAATPQISGTATAAGTYCIGIFDTGNLTAPVTYSITVTHP